MLCGYMELGKLHYTIGDMGSTWGVPEGGVDSLRHYLHGRRAQRLSSRASKLPYKEGNTMRTALLVPPLPYQ